MKTTTWRKEMNSLNNISLKKKKKSKKKVWKQNILKVAAAKMNSNIIVKNLQSKEKINKNVMIMNTTMTKIIATVQG